MSIDFYKFLCTSLSLHIIHMVPTSFSQYAILGINPVVIPFIYAFITTDYQFSTWSTAYKILNFCDHFDGKQLLFLLLKQPESLKFTHDSSIKIVSKFSQKYNLHIISFYKRRNFQLSFSPCGPFRGPRAWTLMQPMTRQKFRKLPHHILLKQ